MFWRVSDSTSRAFRRLGSSCVILEGTVWEKIFVREPRRWAFEEPWCGVPKKRRPKVLVKMEWRCDVFGPRRLSE